MNVLQKTILLGTLALVLSGCGIIPKRVEYFQDKVQPFPVADQKHTEVQKQAARYTADKARETVNAAIKENASTNVVNPALDTVVVAESLSGSMGKPATTWEGAAKELAAKLDKLDAKLDAKIQEFKEENNKNAGKKIEDTGLINISYFSNLFVIILIVGALWFASKLLAVFNPSVGVGLKTITGGAAAATKLVSRGFSELLEGGEHFKNLVDKEFDDPATQQKIKDLFRHAHEKKQSRDVQDVVKELTAK